MFISNPFSSFTLSISHVLPPYFFSRNELANPEYGFLSGGQSSVLLGANFTISEAIDVPQAFGL